MGKRGKKGRIVRKNKLTNQINELEEVKRAPHSFVIHRGNVGQYVQDLTKDFRKVMEPYTASSLKVRKKNSVKDFVSVAGLLNVSHLIMFTRTDCSAYMRLCRLPRGPTLTFKIQKYSLARDVLSQIKKQYVVSKEFRHSPLVVMNSFSGEGAHLKLMTSMFQNMFPPLNLTKINLDTVRRCILFNYNPDTKSIDFRHYGIRVVPVGLSRGVKKIVRSKVPNLSRFNDVSDFITKSEVLSDSEVEDDPNSHVTLPQKLSSRGNIAASQSAIRLCELGPRLNLQLIKVEAGLLDGEVIHHELVHKTDEEKELINKRREERRKLKEKRKKVQEKNKEKKEAVKQELKQKSLEGIKRKQKEFSNAENDAKDGNLRVSGDNDDVDDDVNWYRTEVGEEPDKDLFTPRASQGGSVKRKRSVEEQRNIKRRKLNSVKSNKYSENKHSHFKSKMNKFSMKNKGNKKGKVMGSKVTRGQRHR